MQVQFSKKSLLVIVALYLATSEVWAAESAPKSHEEMRKIMDSCFQSAGLTKPAPGERPTAPTAEQIQAIDACLKENNVQPPARREGRGGGPRPEHSALVQ